MANVIFSRKEIEKEIKVTPEIAEKIMMMGVPVEALTSESLEIQVLPNRPDLLSVQGFLRALKAFTGKDSGLKKYKIFSPEKNYRVIVEPEVSNVRPYTACAIVKKINCTDETIKTLIDLQEKLHSTIGRNRKKAAIGIYPLEKIKLPITYTAKKPSEIKFRPLESEREMTGLEILQKHPTGKDYAHLLENEKLFPVFIDASNSILSMPPIINSHETGKVSSNTKELFIECSGSDFPTLQKILAIIVTTLADMGGTIYSMDLFYGKKQKYITPELKPEQAKVSLENINKTLGLKIKEKELEKLFPKMGYEFKKNKVLVPAWRTDILHEVDLIEDVAIAYGYENIIPELPAIATIGEEDSASIRERKIAEILAGLGMTEISTYHLIKQKEISSIKEEERIELENSKTEYKYARPNLLIPAIRIFSENKDNEYPQEIFEIGKIFKKDSKAFDISEEKHLLVACSPGNITKMKQILDYLFHTIGKEFSISEFSNDFCIEGRTAEIFYENKSIGFMGEIHPKVLIENSLKMPLAVIEINLDKLF